MRKTSGIVLLVLLLAVFFLIGSCQNLMFDTLQSAVRDFSRPSAEIDFLSGSGIAGDTSLTVTFTETMDKGSLVLGGVLAEESSAAWSAAEEADDTLTISPASAWTAGSGKTLTVECADLEGYGIEPLEVNYGVLDGIVYVHASSGNDDNPGTIDLPKQSVHAALAAAERVYSEASLYVAEGTYASKRNR